MKRFWVVLLLFLSVSVFALPGEYFIGKHYSVLIQDWGPPYRVTEDGKGGKILVFKNDKWGTPVDDSYRGGKVYTEVFFVDRRGIVYKWE